jgi:MFS family permease
MGIGMGILTTVTPILTKQLFGQKEYAGIFGIVSMGMSVGSFVSTPMWGMLYDVMGSYNLGFAVMAVMIAVAYLLQMTALKMAKQNFH